MPENSRWVIRPTAETDLSDIWHYGADNWSIEQADRYADGLFALFDLLAEFPEMARERGEFTDLSQTLLLDPSILKDRWF